MDFKVSSKDDLDLLESESGFFIGRKKSVYEKYGEEGGLLLGRVLDEQGFHKRVYLDGLSPHVVFISGARGSGKSYSLGVIAEELVLKNPNVASVVIDPIGIFWSMKFPNRDSKELSVLSDWGLEPTGVENTRVFVPYGLRNSVPGNTYDKLFSLKPSELSVDDWCLTFGIERFSPSGLLLEKAIEKAREKYSDFGLDELIKVIEKDKELVSKEKGYKSDSRRALVSRLEAAKSWGVLSKEGTSLAEVCKAGVISVIDISFLDENVASLVIGMLAKKILNARKLVTRQETMGGFVELNDLEEVVDKDIPPTWLFIDEAHTLIPSGSSKTAATSSLIEYVKQGRRPGCSLVFATQQPSAIDTRVLSQLDLLLCHKLIFNEDLKAVLKRMPTSLPQEFTKSGFIKKLPIGVCLTGDRSDETSRAFVMQVRPRLSQHEGREVNTNEEKKVDLESVKKLLVDLVFKKASVRGKISLSKVDDFVEIISKRYKVKIDSSDIVNSLLKEKELLLKEGFLIVPSFEKKKRIKELGLKAVKLKVSSGEAEQYAEKHKHKKKLGLFGEEEKVKKIDLIYEPLFKLEVQVKTKQGFVKKMIYVDEELELFYKDKKGVRKTEVVNDLLGLNFKKVSVLKALGKTSDFKKLIALTGLNAQVLGRNLSDLVRAGFVLKKDDKFVLKKKIMIPCFEDYDLVLNEEEPRSVEFNDFEVDEKLVKKLPVVLEDARVLSLVKLLKPVWKITYVNNKNQERTEKINAF